jgi:hypothetical protein
VDAELLRLVAALAVAQDAPAAEQGAEGAPIRGTIADVASLRAPGDAADAAAPPAAPPAALVSACAALLRCAGAAGAARLGGRDASALARLAAVVNGNAHGLGAHRHADGTGGADVAAGLFPFLSMFNHSCAPRAVFAAAAPGGVMGVRALRACAAGDELTVAYVNLYESRAARRAATLATKGFACACERCAAPLCASFDARLQGAACRCGDVCFQQEGEAADAGAAALGWTCAGCGCVPAAGHTMRFCACGVAHPRGALTGARARAHPAPSRRPQQARRRRGRGCRRGRRRRAGRSHGGVHAARPRGR